MRVRTLGPDGPEVPAVGVGDVSLARATARAVDAGEVRRALEVALEAGLAVVDVADEADAEQLVGEVVRGLRARDRTIVATRVPALAPATPLRASRLDERLPVRYVQARVEASLRATRLDVIPLAQLELRAEWRSSPAWPELRETSARLVHEGKVLRWGALMDEGFESVEVERPEPPPPPPVADLPSSAGGLLLVSTLDDALAVGAAPASATVAAPQRRPRVAAVLEEGWLSAVSVPLSLCERAAESLLAATAGSRVALLARRPLAGGALAGALGPGVALPPGDDRRTIDAAALERIAVTAAKLAVFVKREPAAARSCEAARAQLERNPRSSIDDGHQRSIERECATLAELALRLLIDRGALVLPRLHRRDHVAEAVLAASAPPLSTPEHIFSILGET
jgi:aryl-alcohol dehydrogenase-like predicted oxidoreductase